MKDYRQLIKELPSSTIVCAVSEFNPPTIGHELLVKTVKKLAEQKGSDHVIYTSPSKNSIIQEDKKEHYLNLMFPNTSFKSITSLSETIKDLSQKYKHVVLVVGSEQSASLKKLVKESSFIQIISTLDKDPDVNSSKMKTFATKGIFEEFKKKLPSSVRELDGRRLMNDVRITLGLDPIKEQLNLVKDNVREQYFRGEIFNVGDIVECNGEKLAVVKRGSNHLLLKEDSGKLVSKWIQDVTPTEEKEMNEDLTDKTLKTNDKIKVARVIATMLGVDKVEGTANPELLVNTALRRIKSKTLNPEALNIVNKMLQLANQVGIQYDTNLIPQKLTQESAPFKKLDHAVAYATDKVKTHRDNLDGIEVYKHKSGGYDVNHTMNANGRNSLNKSGAKHLGTVYKDKPTNIKEDLEEGTFKYHMDKAVAAHMKGDSKKALYHLDNAKTARYAMSTADYAKNKDLLDKYKQMHGSNEPGHSLETTGNDTLRKQKVNHIKEVAPVDVSKVNHAGDEPHDEEWEDTGICPVHNVNHGEEGCEHTRDVLEKELDLTDDEIDHIINTTPDDEFIDEYEDDEFGIIDPETGEEYDEEECACTMQEQAILEVLSRTERMRARIRFAKSKAKRERKASIALRMRASTKTTNKRARRLAIKLMKKRLLRGRDYNKLSVGEKERVERVIQRRKAVIGRVAMKLVPRIRQVEKARLSHTKYTKGSGNVAF